MWSKTTQNHAKVSEMTDGNRFRKALGVADADLPCIVISKFVDT